MTTAWKSVDGIVTKGHRLASAIDGGSPFGAGTIVLQAPIFKERGLDLSRCFLGTLNVSIEPKTRTMLMKEPTFRAVRWHKDYGSENFFFSGCRVRFQGRTYDGWVYYPDPATKEAHFQHPSLFEIIAEPIPGIEYGAVVTVEINPEEISID